MFQQAAGHIGKARMHMRLVTGFKGNNRQISAEIEFMRDLRGNDQHRCKGDYSLYKELPESYLQWCLHNSTHSPATVLTRYKHFHFNEI